MICGYAEILKHSIIKDKKFFNWLKKNTKNIFLKKSKELTYAIKKSCQIKMYFVNKDVNEKNLRMILNFGHTFAHAIEVKNNYSKKITHGEAVLSGMILAARVSLKKKFVRKKLLMKLKKFMMIIIYHIHIKNILNINSINSLIPLSKK